MHQLVAEPEVWRIRQKKREFAPKRDQVTNGKIKKLLNNGIIQEVQYLDWLSNSAITTKKNGILTST